MEKRRRAKVTLVQKIRHAKLSTRAKVFSRAKVTSSRIKYIPHLKMTNVLKLKYLLVTTTTIF